MLGRIGIYKSRNCIRC